MADRGEMEACTMPASEATWFSGAEDRIARAMWVLGVLATAACWWMKGSKWAGGFAIGAACGGLLQAEMAPAFGWQGIFVIGGIVPLLLAVALALLLPESVRFLATRRGTTDRIAGILRQMKPSLEFGPDVEFVLPVEPKKQGFRRSRGCRFP